MRHLALLLMLGLLAPSTALAQHGKKSRSSHAAKESKSKSKGSKGVAGALSDSERPSAPTPPAQPTSAPAPHGPQRIDFDDRVIEGQTNKSGAVYLYDRKNLQVDSMVKQPDTFRSEIAKGLFQ